MCQVLHATPEQVAQLQQAHQIQILQSDATQLMIQGDFSAGAGFIRESDVSMGLKITLLL